MRSGLLILAVLLAVETASAQERKLLVVSVDGLDWRYLSDADKLGLKIPNVRRLMKEGRVAEGVVGEVPTVTWPSHTTMLTGVPPREHGILGNRRPRSEGGDYYWETSLLKRPAIWSELRKAGRKSAAITWPVTVTDEIDYNLPEFFRRRNGGAMDTRSVLEKATPGLAGRISAEFPSFAQEWMNDRTRALACRYLLREVKPDFIALHFVDLDAEAHYNGPFTAEANAVLEYTDELLGSILGDLPKEYALALVSDHGFERVDKVVHLRVLMKRDGMTGGIQAMGGIAAAEDDRSEAWLAKQSAIGRRIPREELARFAPDLLNYRAVFESAPHVMFGGAAEGEAETKPHEVGNHGHWPARYRAVFVLWGPGIKPARTGEMRMTDFAGEFRRVLGL